MRCGRVARCDWIGHVVLHMLRVVAASSIRLSFWRGRPMRAVVRLKTNESDVDNRARGCAARDSSPSIPAVIANVVAIRGGTKPVEVLDDILSRMAEHH